VCGRLQGRRAQPLCATNQRQDGSHQQEVGMRGHVVHGGVGLRLWGAPGAMLGFWAPHSHDRHPLLCLLLTPRLHRRPCSLCCRIPGLGFRAQPAFASSHAVHHHASELANVAGTAHHARCPSTGPPLDKASRRRGERRAHMSLHGTVQAANRASKAQLAMAGCAGPPS